MIYGSIISAIFIIGFAFIILSLANKESGIMKLAGQIIAALVAIVALVVLVLGATGLGHHGMMRGGMMGGGMMWEKGMNCGCTDMMKDTCKCGEKKEMMHKGMKKYGK